VISRAARLRVLDAASASGGKLLSGGTAIDSDGWFVSPAIIADPAEDSVVATEEVFGPVTTITSVATADEAVRRVNSTRYGLVTAVYGSIDRALRVAAGVDTGLVKINLPTTGVDFWLPFGGEKESSYGGREQGTAALAFYTTTRTVSARGQG
jgi:alpha-ketoglutaric semialdehyde dehydrogenase